MERELVSRATLSRLLDVSEETIEKWKDKGILPYYKMPGSSLVRYPLQEVRDWYRRGRVETVESII